MSANLPSLSVVIPVFNEADWIARSVDAVLDSADAAGWRVEVVVVDDGSTDATPVRLDELRKRRGITVVSQANAGRFEARRTGLAKASGEWVALLDSRVIVSPSTLTFLADQLRKSPDRVAWNGHIHVDDHNPYAAFLSGLVKVAWRAYFARPRLTSFGSEEFDTHPKGTTFFCARRDVLERAAAGFTSLYEDIRLASDDTRMLRRLAERERIWLSPDFAATYHGRESFTKFARQAYFRGTTYVDSYLTSPGPARKALFGALFAGALGLAVAVRRPRAAAVAGAATALGAGAAVRKCGGTKAEVQAVAGLLPVFAAAFGAGVVRGLTLATRTRLRRR